MSDQVSLNSYQVLDSIHHSRRFSLYLATKYDTGNEVLIKTPDSVRSKDQDLIASLIAEAKACKALNHPNIRSCYDYTGDAGAAFMVGEYIHGRSLAAYLKHSSEPISVETVLTWLTDILSALEHAHSLGIKHLNLNPHNLIVTKDNHIKIIGFGKDKSAWMHGEQEDFSFHPILFIAPELFQAGIDLPASDIYSVAVIAYLCICKVMPWRIDYALGSVQQKKQSLCRAVIMPEILKVQMPDWLYGVILSCLKLDPHQRIETATELLEAISTQGSIIPPEPIEEPSPAEAPEPVTPAEPELSVVMAEIQEPTPEPEPEPELFMAIPEPIPEVAEPIKPPEPLPAPKQRMYSPPKVPKQQLPDETETKSLSKTFKMLLWASLVVVVFIVFKYYVFGSRPKFSSPADSTDVAEIEALPTEDNKALNMVLVPGDTLVMGSISPEADDDEFPLLTIKLAPFYISPREITQQEWLMVFPTNPSRNKDKDYPVDNVSFYDVIDYCNAKSTKDGYRPCYDYFDTEVVCDYSADGYRLPTEAEWELAAKAGKHRDFFTFSGGNNADELGWHNGNSEAQSHVGAKKKANALGLYDLSGNMYEWVWNWYAPYSYRVNDLNKGADTGTDKVIRGGSWYHSSTEMRVTNRSFAKPYTKSAFIGFRVVRSVAQ